MKILLVVIALFAIEELVEAHPGWAAYPSFQNGRGNSGRGPPWLHSQQMENQNNGCCSDIEWVCQNPKTNDIMIIASDSTQHTLQHRPWHNHIPPGHRGNHPHGNRWTPIIVVQETPNVDQSPTPFPVMTDIPHNNNDKSTQSPPNNGGEGLIDIRIGEK